MPSRFVEVTNPLEAARKTGNAAYVLSQTSFNFSVWPDFSFDVNGTDPNATSTSQRIASALARLPRLSLPSGNAAIMMSVGLVLMLVYWVLIYVETRRSVQRYGHAHAE